MNNLVLVSLCSGNSLQYYHSLGLKMMHFYFYGEDI